MDFNAQAMDVDELVADFVEMGRTDFELMKELWQERQFSFIHEARPKDVSVAFYMQGLFSCALCHIVDSVSLQSQIAGLYVLYMLHRTQPHSPARMIYLSLEQLDCLHKLTTFVVHGKDLRFPFAVIEKMFDDEVFLVGSVSTNQKHVAAAVANLEEQAKGKVAQGRARLVDDNPLLDYLEGSTVENFGLQELCRETAAYAAARVKALGAASEGEMNLSVESALGSEIMTIARVADVGRAEALARLQTIQRQKGDASGRGRAPAPADTEVRRMQSSATQVGPRARTTVYGRELRARKESAIENDPDMDEELRQALEEAGIQ